MAEVLVNEVPLFFLVALESGEYPQSLTLTAYSYGPSDKFNLAAPLVLLTRRDRNLCLVGEASFSAGPWCDRFQPVVSESLGTNYESSQHEDLRGACSFRKHPMQSFKFEAARRKSLPGQGT